MVSFFGCYKMKNYGVGVSRIETITHQKIRIETIKPNSNNYIYIYIYHFLIISCAI